LGILFSLVLATRMGKSEFAVIGATSVIALVNWAVVRR
jgi:hypothetical protein